MNCLSFCFRLRPTKERKDIEKNSPPASQNQKKQNKKGKEEEEDDDEKQIGTFASALLSPLSFFSATTEVSISS
jgi:hypothetical protein